MSNGKETVVGVISDTHGLLRPEAIAALRGRDMIIHAGDVGRPDVLEALRVLAPTFAVRGNVDTQTWAEKLPATEVVEVGPLLIWMLHDIAELDLDPVAAGFAVVDLWPLTQAVDRNARGRALSQSGQCRSATVQAAGDGCKTARLRDHHPTRDRRAGGVSA